MGVGPLIDTHAHLDDPRLAADLPAVLARARAAGVEQVVAIATTADSSVATLAIADGHPGVFAAVGIHPNEAADAGPDDWEQVVALTGRPRVVALGETGLDRHWDRTPFPVQQEFFDRHLDLARDLGLPVVIHCRDAQGDVVAQLARRGGPVRGVLHSFTGTWDDARTFLGLGLHVSFAGMLTFRNKALDPLREAAARVPADRLLIETDSPYLSPHPLRGRTNEPAHVGLTLAVLAELRGIVPVDLARITAANARALFRIPEVIHP